jgi:gliding motility-associated-like protein
VVYNEYGCSDSLSLELFVEPFEIYAPNTFIPDGDGSNDVFKAVTDFEILEWEMVIYNKWGEEVSRSTMINEGWNGTFKNGPAQDGVYVYVVKYKSCANPYNTQMKTGFVNLIR